MKLLTLHFPCFDDALCEIHPSGDLIIGNVALTNVQKKPTKVSVLNYIDRLYNWVSDMGKIGKNRRRTWSLPMRNLRIRITKPSGVNSSPSQPNTCPVGPFRGMLRRQHSDSQIPGCSFLKWLRSGVVGEVCHLLQNTFHILVPCLFLNYMMSSRIT